MEQDIKRLVIISNRLPIVLRKTDDTWQVTPGSGGLVTALAPVLRNRGGLWIGWPGIVTGEDIQDLMRTASRDVGYTLKPVLLTEDELHKFYYGLSNEVIWPLFHDLQSICNFDPTYWEGYKQVNEKYARVVANTTRKDDFIWVHDYHLMLVAQKLRTLRSDAKIGFFLHIPFPPLDIFLKLPWRHHFLQALMDFDLIGFQTLRDRRNFLHCVRTLIKNVKIRGKGSVVTLQCGDRTARVGSFPISIDYREFSRKAASQEVARRAWLIHEDLPDRKIVLGVDRLDYTKGIILRLEAFKTALDMYPELHRRITLVQVVVPSREEIPRYYDLKVDIERKVSDINGTYTESGWIPIVYIHRKLDREELLGYYRTAEIALITPLKDGMNLVAKEFCASSIERNSVLILSEFAGAAAQLQKWVFLVNPYDIQNVAESIFRAFTMSMAERRKRMQRLRNSVSRNDIFRWVNLFLEAAISKSLNNYPRIEDYIPQIEIAP
jgi:trehalose 6-phosphate synthase